MISTTAVSARLWDEPIADVTHRAMVLAAEIDDAIKAALALSEHVALFSVDPLAMFAGCRYRLAGFLDADPGDLVALAALGLVSLAALEEPEGDQPRTGLQLYRRRQAD